MTLQACIVVLLGGFFGGICRFLVSGLIGRTVGETFPWGTLVVNISGAMLVGLFAGAAKSLGGAFASDLLRDFIVVGIFGGYTTVSSFALQTMNLALDGEPRHAVLNIIASTVLCLAAVAAGYTFAISIPA